LASRRNLILGIVIGGFILLFLIFFIIGLVGMMSDKDDGWVGFGDKIAIVKIEGEIINSEKTVEQLRDYAKNSSVKGILIRVNTPGGVVGASQEIYYEVLRVREKSGKPVVISMGSLAASGGYYIACAGDYVFANPGTLTGSIGVILQYPVVKDLLDKVGIQFQTIKTGNVKDVGSPFKYPSEADTLMLMRVIDDSYDQFVEVVAAARGMEREEVLKVADGSIYTGRQAYKLGLVDTLGCMEDAIDYLAEVTGIEGEPKRLQKKEKRDLTVFDLLGSMAEKYLDPVSSGPQLMYLYR